MSTVVLAAIDLAQPESAAAILKRAAQLAELDGAELDVITVVPDYGSSFVGSFFEEGTLERAKEAARVALHDFVDKTLPGHGPVRHIVGCGNVYEEVLEAAERVGADLIVMGASKPDLKTYLLGPNAARVARHAKASVMIVK